MLNNNNFYVNLCFILLDEKGKVKSSRLGSSEEPK